MLKNMTMYFGIMFILMFVFAVGAIEADQYLVGVVFTFAGFVSGITAVYLQEKDKEKNKKVKLYYYNQED